MHSQLCSQMPGHPLTSNKNHTLDFPFRNKQKEPFICLMSKPLPSQTSDSIRMEWGPKSMYSSHQLLKTRNFQKVSRNELDILPDLFFQPLFNGGKISFLSTKCLNKLNKPGQ